MTEKLRTHFTAVLATAVVLGSGLSPSSVSAQTETDNADPIMAPANESRSILSLEVGYFTARREMFRQLYGSFLDYSLSFQRQINKRLTWKLRTEFVRLAENGPELKYWSASVAPMIVYSLPSGWSVNPRFGAGVGLSHRRVIISGVPINDSGDPIGTSTVTQKETNAFLIAMAGGDIPVSPGIKVGLRAYFDYYPWGDPTRGDMGDTGGFHLTARIGFGL